MEIAVETKGAIKINGKNPSSLPTAIISLCISKIF